MYNGLNDFGHEAEALKELGNLAVGGGKYEQALKYVKRGIAAAEKADDIEKMIEFYRLGSNCYTLLGNIDKAVENLTEALVKAEEAGAADAALKVRLDREAIQGMVRREVNPEAMADILAEAERLGNLEVAGDIQMQQATVAFQEGRHEEAYELLLAARNAARDSGDLQRFNRYMMTTMMMVMVKEAMDDRPGVLSALLTCKVYLGAHLGEEVGSQINQILDGLETRWGKAGMADAVRMYQEQAKENPPQP